MPPFLRVSSLRGTHKWQRESSEKSFTRIGVDTALSFTIREGRRRNRIYRKKKRKR
jgi:hypothetical protein